MSGRSRFGPGDWLAVLILLACSLGARTLHLDADPPRWVSTSYGTLVDGGWYLASIAAPDDTAVPESYRRPIYTATARALIGLAGGAGDASAPLPGAIPGALVAPALYLALRRAAGRRAALLAGAFAAIDAVHVAWSRTPVPYPLLSLGAVVALGLALRGVGEEAGPEGTGSGSGTGTGGAEARGAVAPSLAWLGAAALVVAVTAAGVKALGLLALVPVAAAAVVRLGARPRAVLGAAAALAATAGLTLALHDASRERLLEYAGTLTLADVARRAAHVLVESRLAVLAPVAVLACALAPLLLRGDDRSRGRRAADAACLSWTLAGLAALAVLERPDTPYLLAFWPGAVATAALALDRLASGGAAAPARPALAASGVAFVLALVGADMLGGTGALEWLGDPYYFDPSRFLRTLLLAAVVAAIVGPLAARLFARGGAPGAVAPAMPALAAALAIAHLASQAWLVGGYLARPERTLSHARREIVAAVPREARVAEQFAHTLLIGAGPGGPRPRYLICEGNAERDRQRLAPLGATHLALAGDRWSGKVRQSLTTPLGAPVPFASLYVAGVRVRLVRLAGSPLGPSAFERGRERLDAGDPGAAAALFSAALNGAPQSALLRAHLAFARAVAGDRDGAAPPLAEALAIDPASVPARAVRALLDLRRGEAGAALEGIRALGRDVGPDRSVARIGDDLARALEAKDEAAVSEIAGRRIELFVGDLLR